MDEFLNVRELLTSESQYAQRQAALKGEMETTNTVYIYRAVSGGLQSSAAPPCGLNFLRPGCTG